MKMTRKILALILALVMVMGLATTAFAAEHTHTITIVNTNDGYTYKAYQVFSGELAPSGVLSDIEWGEGVDGAALLADVKANLAGFETCNDAEDVAAVLGKDATRDNATARAFAEFAAKYVVAAKGYPSTYNSADEHYVINVTGDGYYLVVNEGTPDTDNTSVSRYIMEVVRNVTVSHKGDFPTVDKKILEGTEKVNVSNESIGDVVNYEIVGTIPNNIEFYSSYYYVFTDTLSKGLTYNNDMKVFVNDVDVTKYFYINATTYNATTGTTITAGVQDLLALRLLDLDATKEGNQPGAITPDTKVVLTYSATLNENAVIAGPNPNTVKLSYDNNPNDDGDGATTPPPPPTTPPTPIEPTGETPDKRVDSYTTELTIHKEDGQGNNLAGAEFQLTGAGVNMVITTGEYFVKVAENTGDYWLLNNGHYTTTPPVENDNPSTPDVDEKTSQHYASLTSDYKKETKVTLDAQGETPVDVKAFVDSATGLLTFTGLGAGTYTLTETTTPVGFNTIDSITFEIFFDAETCKFSVPAKYNIQVEADNTLYTDIVNVTGSTLPSTGGMGTTLFYVIGTVMVLGSAVLLITKKRMIAE